MNHSINCKNCGTELKGTFCQNCGEKDFSDKDFSFFSLFKLSFNTITNFDSKFFKTFLLLLFKQGELSKEFIYGKRKIYMQLFQVFVLANLFFFFFLTEADVFRNPSKWFFEELKVKEEIEQFTTDNNISTKEAAIIYDNQSASLSKSALIILVPVIGFMLLLINNKKKYLFGKHLVFSTHFLSFLMIFMVILYFVISVIPYSNKYLYQIPLFTVIFVYIAVAQKKFYKDSILASLIKSIVITILVFTIILFYRALISYVSLYLIT